MMKPVFFLLISFFVSTLIVGCTQKKEKNNQAYWDIITHRTLGLAYLEENKLDEAESEFLSLIKLSPEEPLGYANLGLVYLRKGQLKDALEQLNNAIDLDPKDPEILLMRARAFELNGKQDKAIEDLEEAIDMDPNHVKSLYRLAEIYSISSDTDAGSIREEYLKRIIEIEPTNIAPRMGLITIQIDERKYNKALENLEEIARLYPELPKESIEYYDKAIAGLQNENYEQGKAAVLFLHNYLRVTASYQSGLEGLKGPGGMLIGLPIITFGQIQNASIEEGTSILGALKFTNVSEAVGLGPVKAAGPAPHISIGDFDHDGDQDFYFGNEENHYIYQNDVGKFSDVTTDLGFAHKEKETDAIFVDFDNDGHLDVFVTTDETSFLFQNQAKGVFAEVADGAGLKNLRKASKVFFFDFDHDGDLDLMALKDGKNGAYQNNSDGTFQDLSEKIAFTGNESESTDAAFGDFDEDGDTDLFIVNKNGQNNLFTNKRQGVFEDITIPAGLETTNGSKSISAGDYNNDGFLDLFISGISRGEFQLYKNQRDGTFELDMEFLEEDLLQSMQGQDSEFFDFDNDGFLDLIIVGNGTFLLHNEGNGKFTDASNLLPPDLAPATRVRSFDFDNDGDLDILLTDSKGIYLLRNDGGNVNHHLKVQLVGLRSGSGKNNYFGIGAKIEMRSGDLYQMKVVTDPVVHFGLGHRTNADVVRILWTNGVPQNIFTPEGDQELVEEQILKGSCPFLYTWNGEKFVFVKDIMWRSALGMPMGIMGGETRYAFPSASKEYIKIPGELLKPKDGFLTLQVTEELWETVYFDKAELVVVDHPESIDIFVDERFTPPPFPGMEIYKVGKESLPIAAVDQNGRDLLELISQKDDKYISNINFGKFQGITEPHSLILDLGDLPKDQKIRLYMNGWIFPSDASINVNISQSNVNKLIPPSLQVMNESGDWVTAIPSMGFPMGKDKTIISDLSGLFTSGNYKVRIQTNMQIYWDHIFFTVGDDPDDLITTRLNPESADLHFRGYSASFRKGGPYGPHWFDYYDVEPGQKWRDLIGEYTRYGDVTELLLEADNKYIIANAGDEVSIKFNANEIPQLPDGWKRDYLIYSVGWVKDGDLNTAFGNTVDPLPFHEMTSYPYNPSESYPTGTEFEAYHKKYNSRSVNTIKFQESILSKE